MSSQAAQQAELQRRRSHATMYERDPYRVPCSRCGAQAGEPCQRPDGERRPAHLERVATDDPQEALF